MIRFPWYFLIDFLQFLLVLRLLIYAYGFGFNMQGDVPDTSRLIGRGEGKVYRRFASDWAFRDVADQPEYLCQRPSHQHAIGARGVARFGRYRRV